MEIVPEVGAYCPTIKRNKVDFPAPLAPIKPTLSPGLMCQFASSYNARDPISNVKLFIDIISNAKVQK
ncbi:hypothetical protein D3C71_1169600 [compost metagenome]